MKNYSYLCTRFGYNSTEIKRSQAPVAELVDAPDLGSGVYDVQVRVLSGALLGEKGGFLSQNRLKSKKNLNFSWRFEIKCLHLQRFM